VTCRLISLGLLQNLVKVHGVLFTNEVDSSVNARGPKLHQLDLSSKRHRQQHHLLIVQARGRPGKVNQINFIHQG
jgi:hypothetical protein